MLQPPQRRIRTGHGFVVMLRIFSVRTTWEHYCLFPDRRPTNQNVLRFIRFPVHTDLLRVQNPKHTHEIHNKQQQTGRQAPRSSTKQWIDILLLPRRWCGCLFNIMSSLFALTASFLAQPNRRQLFGVAWNECFRLSRVRSLFLRHNSGANHLHLQPAINLPVWQPTKKMVVGHGN